MIPFESFVESGPVRRLYIAYHSSLSQSLPSLSHLCRIDSEREGLKAKSGSLVRSFSQSATVVTL